MGSSPTEAADSKPAPAPASPWRSIATSMMLFAAIYAGRGWLLAWLARGRYGWLTLLVDCATLAGVILALRVMDLGVKRMVGHLIGRQTALRDLLVGVTSWCIDFAIAAPFLMALVQFHPQKIGCGATPAQFGMSFEDVVLECDGLQLAAWHIPASAPERPVVVICHGLGANKQNFLPAAHLVRSLDYHAFIFDFRGHGDSDGRTITFGYRESADVAAALAWVRERHPRSKVFGLGYSMGATALLKRAAEQDGVGFDKLVIDSTFARAENVALHSILWVFGPLKRPVWHVGRFWGWVFTGVDVDEHNPEEYIRSATCPILLIHGTADSMIPAAESERLHDAGGKNVELWLMPDKDHLQSLGDPGYRERLRQFFAED